MLQGKLTIALGRRSQKLVGEFNRLHGLKLRFGAKLGSKPCFGPMTDPSQALRKDIKLCLSTWIILEVLCFGIMPLIRIYTLEMIGFWFVPSIIFGILGSAIVAVSTGAVVEARNLTEPSQRQLRFWGARILSLIGFVGISFPLTLALIAFGRVLHGLGTSSGT